MLQIWYRGRDHNVTKERELSICSKVFKKYEFQLTYFYEGHPSSYSLCKEQINDWMFGLWISCMAYFTGNRYFLTTSYTKTYISAYLACPWLSRRRWSCLEKKTSAMETCQTWRCARFQVRLFISSRNCSCISFGSWLQDETIQAISFTNISRYSVDGIKT